MSVINLHRRSRLRPTSCGQSRRQLNRSVKNRIGATTVEFALVVPIIFTMFLGAVEMTRLNFIRHSAANAAYEGARAGIVPGGNETECKKRAKDLMSAVGAGSDIGVSYVADTKTVKVTVTVPIDKNSWGIGRFSCGMQLVQSCQLSREQ